MILIKIIMTRISIVIQLNQVSTRVSQPCRTHQAAVSTHPHISIKAQVSWTTKLWMLQITKRIWIWILISLVLGIMFMEPMLTKLSSTTTTCSSSNSSLNRTTLWCSRVRPIKIQINRLPLSGAIIRCKEAIQARVLHSLPNQIMIFWICLSTQIISQQLISRCRACSTISSRSHPNLTCNSSSISIKNRILRTKTKWVPQKNKWENIQERTRETMLTTKKKTTQDLRIMTNYLMTMMMQPILHKTKVFHGCQKQLIRSLKNQKNSQPKYHGWPNNRCLMKIWVTKEELNHPFNKINWTQVACSKARIMRTQKAVCSISRRVKTATSKIQTHIIFQRVLQIMFRTMTISWTVTFITKWAIRRTVMSILMNYLFQWASQRLLISCLKKKWLKEVRAEESIMKYSHHLDRCRKARLCQRKSS